MQLVSLDPLRVWDIPGVKRLKADEWEKHLPLIRAADWILFPEHWQVNSLVYGMKKRIFPSVSTYQLGYSKAEMTYAFQAMYAECVPYTQIRPRTPGNAAAILYDFPFPFVAKEVRNAMGRGVHLIENRREWEAYVAANERLYAQEYLPIDRDLRVVVIGTEVITAYWRIAPPGGFHNNVAQGGEVSFADVPPAALALVQEVATELNIDHAGFDVAVVNGRFYLLEFNMRFGNQALREQGIRLGPLIYEYLQAQMEDV